MTTSDLGMTPAIRRAHLFRRCRDDDRVLDVRWLGALDDVARLHSFTRLRLGEDPHVTDRIAAVESHWPVAGPFDVIKVDPVPAPLPIALWADALDRAVRLLSPGGSLLTAAPAALDGPDIRRELRHAGLTIDGSVGLNAPDAEVDRSVLERYGPGAAQMVEALRQRLSAAAIAPLLAALVDQPSLRMLVCRLR